jgi:hypothetical protein
MARTTILAFSSVTKIVSCYKSPTSFHQLVSSVVLKSSSN